MSRWTEILESQQPVRRSIDHTVKVFVVNVEGRPLVVKQEICEDEDSAEKVKQRALQMTHKHVCAATAVTSEKRLGGGVYAYVVMPLLSRSLQDDLTNRASHYPEEQLWRYLHCLVDVFVTLQQQEIVHGDIQPKNLLLDNEGEIYVCDFGVGRSFPPRREALHSMQYLSPQVRNQLLSGSSLIKSLQHDPYKSDVYSLGVTLLYMTMLELPSFLTSVTSTTMEHLQHNLNKLFTRVTYYSREWIEVVRWLLLVQEESRLDFVDLQCGLQQIHKFMDDDLIVIPTEEREGSLTVSLERGLASVRMHRYESEEVPCVVSLTASPKSSSRYSVDIVCAIDVSGSMEGDRIHVVQTSLSTFIDSLDKFDRVCLITFSNEAIRHCPLISCSKAGKSMLKKLVADFLCYDLTNISAGFEMAVDVIKFRRIYWPAASIMLFTDGATNTGKIPKEFCLQYMRESGIAKLNVHCFGFSSELDTVCMKELAQVGSGTFHCISTVEDLDKAFKIAFANLTTIVARNVHVSLRFPSDKLEVSHIFSLDFSSEIPVPDIAAESKKDIVFVLNSKHMNISETQKEDAIEAVVTYTDCEGVAREKREKLQLQLRKWCDAKPAKSSSVFAIYHNRQGVEVMRRAEQAAEAGDYQRAGEILNEGIRDLKKCEFAERLIVKAIIEDLEKLLPFIQNSIVWKQGGGAKVAAYIFSHQSQTESIQVNRKLQNS